MSFRKLAIVTVLAALMLSTFVLIQPSLACTQTNQPNPQNVSVQQANGMIKHQSERDRLLILDVRNQSEYSKGHLYNAVLIPLFNLTNNIDQLAVYKNSPIIVYCAAGGRSAPACEILAENGFNKVYNMTGGITAWMQAGYPIDTTYHYISVNVTGNCPGTAVDVQPLLLYQATNNISCSQSASPASMGITGATTTILEQTENHIMMLITYQYSNGSTLQLTLDKTVLLNSTTAMYDGNRTISLISAVLTTPDTTLQLYDLKDVVQQEDYLLIVDTTLVQGSQGYSSALTNMSYTPTTDKGIISLDLVNFNSSITLSDQYKKLGDVTKDIAQVYQSSENKTEKQLSSAYYVFGFECTYLSNIVKTELAQYNQAIQHSVAYLSDDFWSCLGCSATCYVGYAAACTACCLATGICCACFEWMIAFGLDVACSMLCTSWGKCP